MTWPTKGSHKFPNNCRLPPVRAAGAASSAAEGNAAVAGQLDAGQDDVILASLEHSGGTADWGNSL